MSEQPGVRCYPAINPELARNGLKGRQRALEVLSKEESSKKETIAVLFNLFLSISCFLGSLHCITFPRHTDVTLQVPLGSRPNVSRVCEKCPLVTKLMTCKMDKRKQPGAGNTGQNSETKCCGSRDVGCSLQLGHFSLLTLAGALKRGWPG